MKNVYNLMTDAIDSCNLKESDYNINIEFINSHMPHYNIKIRSRDPTVTQSAGLMLMMDGDDMVDYHQYNLLFRPLQWLHMCTVIEMQIVPDEDEEDF